MQNKQWVLRKTKKPLRKKNESKDSGDQKQSISSKKKNSKASVNRNEFKVITVNKSKIPTEKTNRK